MANLTDQTVLETITDVIQTLKAPMQHEGEFNVIKPLEHALEYLQDRLNMPLQITIFNGPVNSVVVNNHGEVSNIHTDKCDTQNIEYWEGGKHD